MTAPGPVRDLPPPFITEVDRLCAALVAADQPDEPADAIWSSAITEMGSLDARAHALWLIWGSLTDALDGPRADAAMQRWARAAMQRAATEWLALDTSDTSAIEAYLDRWVYDECGYERPPHPPSL